MNHKIQAIIERAAQRLVSDNEFVAIIRRARPGAGPIAASVILRALLEVIGEAGVEGALERACIPLGATPAIPLYAAYHAELNKEAVFALSDCRAALRTIKELHQSLPARPSMRKITDDEAHDIAMRDAFGPEGQG